MSSLTIVKEKLGQLPLSERLYYLVIFTLPFFAVSPLIKFFGVPQGIIFGFFVLLTLIAFLKEKGVKPLFVTLWQTPLLKLLLLFLLVNLISLAKAGMGRGFGQENYIKFAYVIFSLLVFWLTANLVMERETFTRIFQVYFLGCTISALLGLYVTLGFMAGFDTGQQVTWTVPRLFGTSGEPQVYGNFLLSIIPIVTVFLLMQSDFINKSVLTTGLAFFVLAMVMTFSAGAWAGFIGSLSILIIGLKHFKLKGILAWISSVVIVILVVIMIDHYLYPGYAEGFKSIVFKLTPQTVQTKETYLLSVGSGIDRWNLRQAAWKMFRTHPILGVGMGNFGYLYNAYRPVGAEAVSYVAKAHNQYLEVLAETGIIGFAIFMVIIVQAALMFWRSFQTTRSTFWKAIVLGSFASLVGIAIQGYSFGFFVHIYTWVLLGLLVSAYRQTVKNPNYF